jgi:hypothetical protein
MPAAHAAPAPGLPAAHAASGVPAAHAAQLPGVPDFAAPGAPFAGRPLRDGPVAPLPKRPLGRDDVTAAQQSPRATRQDSAAAGLPRRPVPTAPVSGAPGANVEPPTHRTGELPAYRTGELPAYRSGELPIYRSGELPVYRSGDEPSGYRADEPPAYRSGVPAPRLSPEVAAPGSRTDWPLNPSAQIARSGEFPVIDPLSPTSYPIPNGAQPAGRDALDLDLSRDPDPLGRSAGNGRSERVTPPWLADDLPVEPAMLRLVEPAPLADPALREGAESARPGRRAARDSDSDDERPYERSGRAAPSLRLIGGSAPVDDESDGDLLIFSQIQSAWFSDVDDPDTSVAPWESSPADLGWQAAERAATPVLGDATEVGLPRRVPQANLVPGSPLPPATNERGLRVVRDPAAMAAHTTGYFRGSRRGEEVRSFSIGGRPGRESAGGWDFSRDSYEQEQEREDPLAYRSAARR